MSRQFCSPSSFLPFLVQNTWSPYTFYHTIMSLITPLNSSMIFLGTTVTSRQHSSPSSLLPFFLAKWTRSLLFYPTIISLITFYYSNIISFIFTLMSRHFYLSSSFLLFPSYTWRPYTFYPNIMSLITPSNSSTSHSFLLSDNLSKEPLIYFSPYSFIYSPFPTFRKHSTHSFRLVSSSLHAPQPHTPFSSVTTSVKSP